MAVSPEEKLYPTILRVICLYILAKFNVFHLVFLVKWPRQSTISTVNLSNLALQNMNVLNTRFMMWNWMLIIIEENIFFLSSGYPVARNRVWIIIFAIIFELFSFFLRWAQYRIMWYQLRSFKGEVSKRILVVLYEMSLKLLFLFVNFSVFFVLFFDGRNYCLPRLGKFSAFSKIFSIQSIKYLLPYVRKFQNYNFHGWQLNCNCVSKGPQN